MKLHAPFWVVWSFSLLLLRLSLNLGLKPRKQPTEHLESELEVILTTTPLTRACWKPGVQWSDRRSNHDQWDSLCPPRTCTPNTPESGRLLPSTHTAALSYFNNITTTPSSRRFLRRIEELLFSPWSLTILWLLPVGLWGAELSIWSPLLNHSILLG